MARSAVEIVMAFQPDAGSDVAQMLGSDANPEVVEAALAAVAPLVADNLVCAFHALGSGERRGLPGLREVWLDWLGPWESYRTGDKEYVDVDGERVLVLVQDFGRPRGMRDEVELHGAALYTVRGGKIARIEFYAQRMDAYAAAGLEPPA